MVNTTQMSDLQDDVTLKLWGGDESVKGSLLVHWGGKIEKAIRKAFPTLTAEDAEDVVCEAIQRFWVWRERFDPDKSSVHSRLYWFAEKVAMEFRAGQLKRHRARIHEKGVDAEFFDQVSAPEREIDPADDVGTRPSSVQKALEQCFRALSDLQQDILRAYADAGDYELAAAELGKEMGDKHKNGVPIPAGTIRTNKSRAWRSLDGCMRRKNLDMKTLGYTND